MTVFIGDICRVTGIFNTNSGELSGQEDGT